jgi:hypothetical protein
MSPDIYSDFRFHQYFSTIQCPINTNPGIGLVTWLEIPATPIDCEFIVALINTRTMLNFELISRENIESSVENPRGVCITTLAF